MDRRRHARSRLACGDHRRCHGRAGRHPRAATLTAAALTSSAPPSRAGACLGSRGCRGPTSHSYFSQRLRLHYLDWGNPEAPPLLLIHGNRDHAHNWDWAAARLQDRYHIVAPDLRGHGDSQWSAGSMYAPAEFVYDIAQLVHQQQLAPLRIVAHSLGGNIALRYAGTYPEDVERLVVIEGWGGIVPEPRAAATRRSACGRGSGRSGRSPPASRGATRRSTTPTSGCWRPTRTCRPTRPATSRSTAPTRTRTARTAGSSTTTSTPARSSTCRREDVRGLWRNITCPVLLISGSESWLRSGGDPDELVGEFADARHVVVDGAGHWVQHDQLDPFLELVERLPRVAHHHCPRRDSGGTGCRPTVASCPHSPPARPASAPRPPRQRSRAFDPWRTWRDDPGPLGAVAAAVLAANPHNSQPWTFAVAEQSIDVFADRTRTTVADAADRRAQLSGGRALQRIHLAATRDGIALAATRVRTLHRPGAGTARRGGSSPDATPNRSPITTRRSVAPGPQRSHSPTSSRSRPPHTAPCAAGNRRRRSACTIALRTCAPSTAWRPHPMSEPPASSSSTAPGPRRSADRGSAQLDLDLPQLCGEEGAPGGSGSGHDAIGVAHGAWQ